MNGFHMDGWFTVFTLVVALGAAGGGMLLLVGYIITIPATVAHGWRWLLVSVALPVIGPVWFCHKHGPEWRRTQWQLIAGAVLLAVAIGSLYGFGPYFAARAMAQPASGG